MTLSASAVSAPLRLAAAPRSRWPRPPPSPPPASSRQFAFDAGANIVSLLSGRYLICAAMLWAVVALLRLACRRCATPLLVLGLGMV